MGVKLKKNGGSVSWKKYYQNKAPNYFNNNNKEIKRLQEENEKLKEQLDILVKDDEKQQKIIIELQHRINKAIEYINRNTCTNVEEQCNSIYLYDEYLNNLLDILRGNDEERNNRNTIKKSNL